MYVNDIILAGNDKGEIERVKEALNKTFEIKDLGDLRYFLGFEVVISKKGVSILTILKDLMKPSEPKQANGSVF